MSDDTTKPGRGRPTIRTEESIEAILDGLSNGIPLARLCKDETMPSLRVVYNWMDEDPDFSARVARARETGEEIILCDVLTIADSPLEGYEDTLGFKEIPNPDDPEGPVSNELVVTERKRKDMLGHRKLQVDTRLRLLAKLNPGRWGERVALDHGVQGDLAQRLLAAQERLRQARGDEDGEASASGS